MALELKHKDTIFHIGDQVGVHITFSEGDKKKTQVFKGIVIATRGRGSNKMFTVRRMTRDKVGVERIFPLVSPSVEKVELIKKGTVKRAKIRFIRDMSERQIRDRLSFH